MQQQQPRIPMPERILLDVRWQLTLYFMGLAIRLLLFLYYRSFGWDTRQFDKPLINAAYDFIESIDKITESMHENLDSEHEDS